MARQKRQQNRMDVLQGTLSLLLLQSLRCGAQHGYGISQAIRAGSGDVFQLESGSLYPALHRLQKQGWVSSEWKASENNQRAKYYRLTAAGKKQLANERGQWDRFSSAVTALLKAAGAKAATQ